MPDKMHQNTFGNRAPPRPDTLGGLMSFPDSLATTGAYFQWGTEGRGRECVQSPGQYINTGHTHRRTCRVTLFTCETPLPLDETVTKLMEKKQLCQTRVTESSLHSLDIVGGGLTSANAAAECDERDKQYRTNSRADTDVEDHSRINSVVGYDNKCTQIYSPNADCYI